MNSSWPLLSVITFLPLSGVLFLMLVRGTEANIATNAKLVALWVAGFTFFLSLFLYVGFDPDFVGYQFEEQVEWISGAGISYHLGIDGISMPFILLSTFLVPLSILASWSSITHRVRDYMMAFLVLETMMVGMFASLDILMFYLFFEGVLIPMFLIIGIWGGTERVYAAFKFFLYTLLGSVLMLVCMLVMYQQTGSTDIPELSARDFAPTLQFWLFLGFFASFAVKVPMWPVHTWLPDAHVQAPTAGSMILAGV
ncbi:MAG: NADH-quinone oxidoreductase subunit M, partial [Alphaproteobacteria bacterium]|nr:NADH-quinone oxidoreductase subunit M [Alphaproteobacteria bacterium]